ncbi:uncharacterized protein J4E84_000116 [Alternaria hordeiaustralica]|uniref:uncharacterized protein n=1 Tax=Alternaria hordeiaustralica TaxID=1187925 RepID=UPI0020C408E7|nr:uncharacterized protein J4E84_000116 [Alternaria hordeiaustralica]KAI4696992.1 hypothetical protein J4E84_000116 [Alternaria hordeiaustralica]
MSNSLEAKIVVLGSQGVGKTSLVHRYVKNAFTPPTTQSTVGASFLTKRVVDIDTSTVVRLQIWDTAGQERFRSISKLYYRGANAAVLCYDITDPYSFEEMGRWFKELKTNLGEDVILHVVGTKSDVVAEDPTKRKVPFERCIAYVAENLHPTQNGQPHSAAASGWGSVPAAFHSGMASPQSNRSSGFWGQDLGWDCCHEISAKDGEGVDEVFRVITRKLVEQQQKKLEEEQRQYAMAGVTPAMDNNGNVAGYFDYPGTGNGSFRLGTGDKRRSWLGFPTTPNVAGHQQDWEEDINRAQKSKSGRSPIGRLKGRIVNYRKRLSQRRKPSDIEDPLAPYPISMDDFPRGYPSLAAFQSSKPDFSIYRAFNYLHSRVILELQDQLCVHEDDLALLDEFDAMSEDQQQRNRVSSRRADADAARLEHQNREDLTDIGRSVNAGETQIGVQPGDIPSNKTMCQSSLSERASLLAEIHRKLVQYDDILTKSRELAEFQRPSERERSYLCFWDWNTKPLPDEEQKFMTMRDDLVILKPRRDSSNIDEWIERIMDKMPVRAVAMSEKWLTTSYKYFVKTGTDRERRGEPRFYHITRIQRLAVLIIVTVIILLLAAPVFIMYRVTWDSSRSSTFLNIGLMIVFSLLFSASMGLLTKAKRAELFAATAAYCAVLIVFIGNFSSNAT